LDLFAAKGAQKETTNPLPYDVSRFSKTDPKLIAYRKSTLENSAHRGATPRHWTSDTLYICAGNFLTAMDSVGHRGLENRADRSGVLRCGGQRRKRFSFGLRDHIEVFDAKARARRPGISPGKKNWFTGLALTENEVFAAGRRPVVSCCATRQIRENSSAALATRTRSATFPGFIIPSPYLDVGDRARRFCCASTIPDVPGRDLHFGRRLRRALGANRPQPSEGFVAAALSHRPRQLPDARIVTCEKGLPRVKIYSAAVSSNPSSRARNLFREREGVFQPQRLRAWWFGHRCDSHRENLHPGLRCRGTFDVMKRKA
jgi:hypothetical protein